MVSKSAILQYINRAKVMTAFLLSAAATNLATAEKVFQEYRPSMNVESIQVGAEEVSSSIAECTFRYSYKEGMLFKNGKPNLGFLKWKPGVIYLTYADGSLVLFGEEDVHTYIFYSGSNWKVAEKLATAAANLVSEQTGKPVKTNKVMPNILW